MAAQLRVGMISPKLIIVVVVDMQQYSDSREYGERLGTEKKRGISPDQ